ncbi:MAG: hypothetical protein V1729_07100 [Candidatus Woesearchaeota archaeon]
MTDNPATPEYDGTNIIPGGDGVCNPMPDATRDKVKVDDDYEARMKELGDRMEAKLEKRPGAFDFKYN